jgi:hypothetical protein
MLDSVSNATTRYGCQEFREDAELVLGGRAQASVVEMYQAHRRDCPDCRRFHGSLRSAYEGPALPPEPGAAKKTREFAGILRRVEQRRPRPWWQRVAAPAGVVGLTATAAALALSLMSPRGVFQPEMDHTGASASSHGTKSSVPTKRARADEDTGGIEHHAQGFGRVVAGSGVLTDQDANLIPTDTFTPGTHFHVAGSDALQIGLVGKILANIQPRSRGHWDTASPGLIELTLDRGMIAMRYERREADPILHVRTPNALVRVTGTVFTVAVDDTGDTIVSVLRGEVEVLEPGTHRLLAEVEAGYRFDVASSAYGDVGREEVAAALPLSVEFTSDGSLSADGRIPESWVVPGLVASGELRRLDQVINPMPASESELSVDEDKVRTRRSTTRSRRVSDEGDDLMETLLAEAQRSREARMTAELSRCREFYASTRTRFRAASCLTKFMAEYGEEPGAVEGLLLIGILRMDFAHDYQAANLYFEEFLRRAPHHPKAELATYKRWLASTEAGRIPEALDRGRGYLQQYPGGRYVGRVLSRFPELKEEL